MPCTDKSLKQGVIGSFINFQRARLFEKSELETLLNT